MQQTRHVINALYHCQRAKQDGLILVFNADEYLMAEYSERTGALKYQRLVPAPQKDVIERWLGQHFPVNGGVAKTPAARAKSV